MFFKSSSQNGFTLIEVAVVMVIMGSLLSGLLAALTQSTANTRQKTAENQLARIEEALYGYAQANGRLPCPAGPTSGGLEVQALNVCTFPHGFVPNATLNLYGQINGDGLMNDPWNNPYRYSVSDLNASNGSAAFTTAVGLSDLFANPGGFLVAGGQMIQICDENTCANPALSDVVPAIVFSMGENWATTNNTCGAVLNLDEAPNAGAISLAGTANNYCVTNTMTFVARTYVEDVFDDVVIWLSPHILFSRMISAGQLP